MVPSTLNGNYLWYLYRYLNHMTFSEHCLMNGSQVSYRVTVLSRKRNSIGVEANYSARNGTHWTSRIVETTHRPWIVGGSENSTSLHAVLQDSRWPTLSTSGMTLACAGTSNCIQMQLFSRIPRSLSACQFLSLYLASFKRERSVPSFVYYYHRTYINCN